MTITARRRNERVRGGIREPGRAAPNRSTEARPGVRPITIAFRDDLRAQTPTSWWIEAGRGLLALLAAISVVLALVGGALVLSRLALRVIE